MSTQRIKKFHWFWPWQDKQEQEWLEKMSREGLHLISVLPFGIYQFTSGKPQSLIYMLDFDTSNSGRSEYLQERKEAGCEHVATMAGWQYFRRPLDTGDVLPVVLDNKMMVQKYRRLLGYLVIFLPIWLILLNRGMQATSGLIQGFTFSLMVLFIITVIKVMQRVRQLEKQPVR